MVPAALSAFSQGKVISQYANHLSLLLTDVDASISPFLWELADIKRLLLKQETVLQLFLAYGPKSSQVSSSDQSGFSVSSFKERFRLGLESTDILHNCGPCGLSRVDVAWILYS